MLKGAGTLGKSHLSWGEYLRIAGKKVVGYLCMVRPNQRPIFIFSTRRSGSTLLLQMLHSQPGVDYIDEPLNLWRLHPYLDRLPHPSHGYFITLTPDDEEKLYDYMQDLLTGRIRFRQRGNLLDPGRTFLVQRFVVKNINATPLIDWFAEWFDAYIVYLLRHPGAVAESLVRRGWGSATAAYLEDRLICKRYLSSELVRYAQRVLEQGDTFQKCVIEWCLDNLRPQAVWKERPRLTLSYEEVVLRPLKMSKLICDRLGMPNPMRMAQVIASPSRTATTYSRYDIVEKGPQHLVERWLGRIEKDNLKHMQEALDIFEVQVYKAHSPFPCPDLCHFGPLDSSGGMEKGG